MKDYDLIILGGGSGNMLPEAGFGSWKVAIVEPDRMGGTCLNRGCIPSKCFVYTADVAHHIRGSGTFNLSASLEHVDWPGIRDRVFARIDPMHQRAVDFRRNSGVDVYTDTAEFVDSHELKVGDDVLRAGRIVVAAGSRPFVPPVDGLSEVDFHTSDTIMRIDRLPESMIVFGGGYIAAEMAHVFGSLGTRMTVINRSNTLLGSQDYDVAECFTDIVKRRWDLRLGTSAVRAYRRNDEVVVDLEGNTSVAGEVLLVATGRVANTDTLNAAAAGIACDESGSILADEFGRTNVDGIWSLGDISNHIQLKHVANAQARAVFHNVANTEHMRKPKLGVIPATVFTEPQVASVGETEGQLRDRGARYVSSTKPFSDTAYGWAMEDTTSFAKVLVDPDTDLILGAHIIGPQASLLIQPLVQAMSLGNTVTQVATAVMYPHPALTEVVEQVLLEA